MTISSLPLGTVVHDVDGNPWVSIGYTTNTIGTVFHYFQVCIPMNNGRCPDWDYRAAYRQTLLKKFPDLKEFELIFPEDGRSK